MSFLFVCLFVCLPVVAAGSERAGQESPARKARFKSSVNSTQPVRHSSTGSPKTSGPFELLSSIEEETLHLICFSLNQSESLWAEVTVPLQNSVGGGTRFGERSRHAKKSPAISSVSAAGLQVIIVVSCSSGDLETVTRRKRKGWRTSGCSPSTHSATQVGQTKSSLKGYNNSKFYASHFDRTLNRCIVSLISFPDFFQLYTSGHRS